jgi:hypothetical protein
MKKLYKVALLLITIVIISCLSTFEVYAYGEHQSLVTASFDILEDEREDTYQFYSENHYNTNYMTIIIANSQVPDAQSTDGGESINGTHYYVYEGTPSTNGNYYKNNVLPFNGYGISARTRFEDHYGNAINCYKNGDYSNAMQSLGRAIHYLQDIGCTPHSAGLTWTSSNSSHAKFENYINANLALFITEAKQNHVANYGATDFGKYDLYLSNYEEICNSLAAYSCSFEDDL